MKFERNANYHHQLNCFLVWQLLYFGIQAKLVLDWYVLEIEAGECQRHFSARP